VVPRNGADDRVRTGDLNLGKVPRYQLRYVRVSEAEIYPKPGLNTQSSEYGADMDEPAFWMSGILARDLVEVSSDPTALDKPGFWAVVATFEGEWQCARFATVTRAPLPPAPWNGLLGSWQSTFDQVSYEKYVQDIRELIARGEVYQVNACRIISTHCDQSLLGLFQLMSIHNPSPYAAYLNLPGLEIASASPELFLNRNSSQNGVHLLSSPIKGTSDIRDFGSKDQAENVMIVDLIRNDFGQICIPGSVEVPRLLGVEEHPGLFHLVSDVTGILRVDTSWNQIATALMPPGSVSGAPKSSALKIISENEPDGRGPYCGAIGWVQDGKALLSVGIRLFWKDRRSIINFGTGAGITWGSDPTAEWNETELKANRLIAIANGEYQLK
jgi:para-aminobenzoate synthetase component 1